MTQSAIDRPMTSYGSEEEFIRREIDPMQQNGNGNNTVAREAATRTAWDVIFKVSQIAVLPLLAAMLYLLTLINAVERQYAVIDAKLNSLPNVGDYITKVAVLEERQAAVRDALAGISLKLADISNELERHREFSDYEGPSVKRPRLSK